MISSLIHRDPSTASVVRPIELDDLDRLSLSFWSRVTTAELEQVLRSYPGRSVWNPATLEYAIVAPWRHRPEIAHIKELSAARNPAEMLQSIVQHAEGHGASLVMTIELDEARVPAFYTKAGLTRLEEVVTYELDARRANLVERGRLEVRLVNSTQVDLLKTLERVDQAAFPWLWRNNEAEFRAHLDMPGVEFLLGFAGNVAVGYVGITTFLGWGHLDRIAVDPAFGGQGFGRELLATAIARLVDSGARRIGLSTQKSNARSRRLYEQSGFERTGENEYRVYGCYLKNPDSLARS